MRIAKKNIRRLVCVRHVRLQTPCFSTVSETRARSWGSWLPVWFVFVRRRDVLQCAFSIFQLLFLSAWVSLQLGIISYFHQCFFFRPLISPKQFSPEFFCSISAGFALVCPCANFLRPCLCGMLSDVVGSLGCPDFQHHWEANFGILGNPVAMVATVP